MKRKVLTVSALILGVLLVVPFLVPVNSSGTLTNREAAKEVWGERSQFVEIAGNEVHLVSAGDPKAKQLFILLHGFGASALSYLPVLDELAAVGEVVAYDRAAFGFSERPESFSGTNPYSAKASLEVLDGIIDRFNQNQQVVLVGHSAGGQIAAAYALEHPERVDYLVLEDAAIYSSGGTPTWLNWLYFIPQLNHLGPALVSTIATSGLEILNQSYFDQNKITEQTLAHYTQPLKVVGWERAFWEFNRADRRLDVASRLAALKTKTLVLTGDNDTIVATEDSLRLAAELGLKPVVISECGHLPHEEQPQQFLKSVLSFTAEN
ncbi:alpha/beta hydrolase [Aquiluna borgnonia]|uniref:Alpha/beta hydrolase n=1 Tax=Aquiluna borgnonia TaxID=2499157 RepID=A0A7D4PQ08_9MICO|nr:alpha/beta hydrolase [Aquiluna borgnonia]QKJ24686.1 alpha/beta hydrolase [Aquiluna borgnonia]